MHEHSPEFNGVFRRRQLPHWVVEGKPIFITRCLKGSLSNIGLKRIRQYRQHLDDRQPPPDLTHAGWELKKDKLVFKLMDNLLDEASPVKHLEDERQAKVVFDALLHFANERYKLFAFVVMPSHHHWLFLPAEEWVARTRGMLKGRTPREFLSQTLQSYTANCCNKLRGESGQYWQHKTFDHWVRHEAELFRIVYCIENNPVKAGLTASPTQYRWSSAPYEKCTEFESEKRSAWDKHPGLSVRQASSHHTDATNIAIGVRSASNMMRLGSLLMAMLMTSKDAYPTVFRSGATCYR